MSRTSEQKHLQKYRRQKAVTCKDCVFFSFDTITYPTGYTEKKNKRCKFGGFKCSESMVCDMIEIKKIEEKGNT